MVPPSFDGMVFLWNQYRANSKQIISIPYELEVNAKKYRDRYLDLINSLSRVSLNGKEIDSLFEIENGFSLWWMNLTFEKNYGKSDLLSDAVKLIVFESYLKEFEVTKIFYSENTSDKLINHFKNCSSSISGFEAGDNKRKRKVYKSLFRIHYKQIIPLTILGLVAFFRYISFCGGVHFQRKAIIWNRSDVHFFDYFFHLLPGKEADQFESAYWGPLLSLIRNKKEPVTFSHIYIPDSKSCKIANVRKKIKSFNEKSGEFIKHNLVEELSFTIVLKVFYKYIKFNFIYLFFLSFRLKSKINSEDLRLSLFLWSELSNSLIGNIAIQNLFTFYLIQRIVKKTKVGTKLIYLLENQSWEKALVYLWKREVNGKTIGVAHATVRFWDLRYSYSRNQSGFQFDQCKPDSVTYNGSLAKKQLIGFGYSKKLLIPSEALRFTQLNFLSFIKTKVRKKKVILVFTDYLFSVSKFQLNLLENSNLTNNYKVIVKPHPACPINPLDFPKLNFELSYDSSSKLLENSTIVFTSNITSAAIEAYYLGLPVISSRDPKELNFSPLFGIDDVMFVSSTFELEEMVLEIERRPIPSKRKDIFFLSENLEKWKKIISV